jgi:hypothetical protein
MKSQTFKKIYQAVLLKLDLILSPPPPPPTCWYILLWKQHFKECVKLLYCPCKVHKHTFSLLIWYEMWCHLAELILAVLASLKHCSQQFIVTCSWSFSSTIRGFRNNLAKIKQPLTPKSNYSGSSLFMKNFHDVNPTGILGPPVF